MGRAESFAILAFSTILSRAYLASSVFSDSAAFFMAVRTSSPRSVFALMKSIFYRIGDNVTGDFSDGVHTAASYPPAELDGLCHGHPVHIFEVASYRNTEGYPGDLDVLPLKEFCDE